MAVDNIYQPGDIVPLEATFKNAAGTPTNTTVTLTVRAPDGTTTTPSPSNPSTGVYHYDYQIAGGAPEGVWEYIFSGTGTVTAVERGTFVVEPLSLLQRLDLTALVTLADVRAFVFRDVTDNSQDRELIERINEYSRAVYRYTGREWLPQTAATARVIAYDGSGFLSLAPYEARTVTAVQLFSDAPAANRVSLAAGSPTVEAEWRLGPHGKTEEGTYLWIDLPRIGIPGQLVDGERYSSTGAYSSPSAYPYFRNRYEVTVTGDWGVAATLAGVPADVQLAVKVAVKDAFVNPGAFATGTLGAQSFTEETTPEAPSSSWARNLPYESRALLEPYRRERGFVLA